MDISSHQPNYLGRIFDQYTPDHVVVKLYLPIEQGLWPVTIAQAGSARALGATVGGYVWGYRSVDPRRTARDAIGIATTAGIHPLPVLWLDCETYGEGDELDPGPDAPWLRAFFDECGKFKQRAGLYTGRWWVKQYFPGGEAAFAEFNTYPLWLADYDKIPDTAVWWPFSGFERLAGKQYKVDKAIYRNGIDLDVFGYAYTVPEDS